MLSLIHISVWEYKIAKKKCRVPKIRNSQVTEKEGHWSFMGRESEEIDGQQEIGRRRMETVSSYVNFNTV